MNKRSIIIDTVDDLVADFLFYARKEDEELKNGDIETCIKQGDISSTEIIDRFGIKLRKALGEI